LLTTLGGWFPAVVTNDDFKPPTITVILNEVMVNFNNDNDNPSTNEYSFYNTKYRVTVDSSLFFIGYTQHKQ